MPGARHERVQRSTGRFGSESGRGWGGPGPGGLPSHSWEGDAGRLSSKVSSAGICHLFRQLRSVHHCRESQKGLGLKGPSKIILFNPLPWAGMSFARSDCSKFTFLVLHPTSACRAGKRLTKEMRLLAENARKAATSAVAQLCCHVRDHPGTTPGGGQEWGGGSPRGSQLRRGASHSAGRMQVVVAVGGVVRRVGSSARAFQGCGGMDVSHYGGWGCTPQPRHSRLPRCRQKFCRDALARASSSLPARVGREDGGAIPGILLRLPG